MIQVSPEQVTQVAFEDLPSGWTWSASHSLLAPRGFFPGKSLQSWLFNVCLRFLEVILSPSCNVVIEISEVLSNRRHWSGQGWAWTLIEACCVFHGWSAGSGRWGLRICVGTFCRTASFEDLVNNVALPLWSPTFHQRCGCPRGWKGWCIESRGTRQTLFSLCRWPILLEVLPTASWCYVLLLERGCKLFSFLAFWSLLFSGSHTWSSQIKFLVSNVCVIWNKL